MTRCYRCHKEVPEPDIKEAIAREADWRDWLEEHPTEALQDGKVLICMQCADELESEDDHEYY